MQLGVATDSRKVVNILNRLGHCASYSIIEGLETKLLFVVTKEERLIQDGMSLNAAINIDVAFDNFDRLLKTVSGKDTLHDTVSIAYKTSSSATGESVSFQVEDDQEVKVSTHIDKESLVVTSGSSPNKKRRRKFVATGLVIEPYMKNPNILLSGVITRSDVIQNEAPSSLFSAKVRNCLCMPQCSLSNNSLMWIGWN